MDIADEIVSFPFTSREDRVPATNILIGNKSGQKIVRKQEVLFCYHAILKTLHAFKQGTYTDFDAHTTTNCCHGITLLARDLLMALEGLDCKQWRMQGEQKAHEVQDEASGSVDLHAIWSIPPALAGLAVLYVLAVASRVDEDFVTRTSVENLSSIYAVSKGFSRKLVRGLQTQISNYVADRYMSLCEDPTSTIKLAGIPLNLWKRYVGSKYLRSDRRSRWYASAAYSMQTTLGHMIQNKGKVALVNDLMDASGEHRGRYTQMFVGDGIGKLQPISGSIEMGANEPVMVLGGACYSDTASLESLSLAMARWTCSVDSLILACDCHYPQFPAVSDDSGFDCTPIYPEEEELREAFRSHLQVKGVSQGDPSLFCLTHIYPASFAQVKNSLAGNRNAIPVSAISAFHRDPGRSAQCA